MSEWNSPRDAWPQDALTRFLVTEVDGERLEPRAIRTQIMFMIGAGSDTTRNLIGNLLYRLATAPALYAQLRADRGLVDVAIEEALRLDAPAQFLVRTCQRDTDLADVPVEQGQRVFMCIGSGNRDDTVFDDADAFRLDRTTRDHLSFGSGPHICPGASLARLEARTALHAFVERVERVQPRTDLRLRSRAVGDVAGPQDPPTDAYASGDHDVVRKIRLDPSAPSESVGVNDPDQSFHPASRPNTGVHVSGGSTR